MGGVIFGGIIFVEKMSDDSAMQRQKAATGFFSSKQLPRCRAEWLRSLHQMSPDHK